MQFYIRFDSTGQINHRTTELPERKKVMKALCGEERLVVGLTITSDRTAVVEPKCEACETILFGSD